MGILDKALRLFGAGKSKQHLGKSDIKLSTLVESIHRDLVSANESFQSASLEYIEGFFYKSLSEDQQTKVINQLDQISNSLEQDNQAQAKALLASLKAQISRESTADEVEYKAKVVKLDIPVRNNGSWQSEQITMPLIAFVPLSIPKVTNCTITSQLGDVKQQGDEVYIQVLSSKDKNKSKLGINPASELVLSIEPSQSNVEIDELISKYKKQLTENSLINKNQ